MVASLQAERAEQMRALVRQLVEFAIGDRLAGARHLIGDLVRRACGVDGRMGHGRFLKTQIVVVPANAGTHNHRLLLVGPAGVPARHKTHSYLWLWVPWVHDTSATPARVLWRWDNVMASSALKSALRSTGCMQPVDLKTKLRLRLTGRRRRSVGNCGATPGLPRSGPGATSLSGLSNWPSAGDGGMAASSWRASRTCGTAWAIALRWDIPQSRSLADWRWNMVVSSSAMS